MNGYNDQVWSLEADADDPPYCGDTDEPIFDSS